MRTISVFRPTNKRDVEGRRNRASELNLFTYRFDTVGTMALILQSDSIDREDP